MYITKNLFYRQRILLAVLETFGGSLSGVDLQKYLFLFTQNCQQDKSYEFVPYKFGCFSFQSYADRRKLVKMGLLNPVDHWQLADGISILSTLKSEDKKKLELFCKKYSSLKGEELVRAVYLRYPYYAIRSEIAAELLSESEQQIIEAAIPDSKESILYTIGYEGQSFENYLNRLIKNNVHILVDVRKNPLSRKYGFSRKTLSETLETLDIVYLHMPELGIVSEKRQMLQGQSDYNELFDEYEKTVLANNSQSIERLFSLFLQYKRVAITCFEAEACMCHRSRVADALTTLPEWDSEIVHI